MGPVPPMPEMAPHPDMQVRVKNTFLELVDDDEVQPTILRAKTDTTALRQMRGEAAAPEGQLLPQGSASGIAMATAAAAASAAMAAARAAAAAAAVSPGLAAAGGLPMPGFGGLPLLPEAAFCPGKPATKTAGRPQPKDRAQGRAVNNAESVEAAVANESGLTTIMLRNLPNDYTRSMLLELLDASGLAGRYDFLYLPTDFSRKAGLGYAFVNMVSPEDAQHARSQLEGFRQWSVPSGKVCSVGWSNPCQGLEANIERYRNSPIMHESVPDEFKPMVFTGGVRTHFPKPTKKLRKPDMGKHGRNKNS